MHYGLMTGFYRCSLTCSFDFAFLTLTVFTTLRNSIREKNYNPLNWNSEINKSEVKREKRDL